MLQPQSNRYLVPLFAVAFAVASPLLTQAVQAPAPPAAPVRVAPVEQLEMTALAWVPGSVMSRGDVRLAAEVGGRLAWMADVGDTVAAGQPIAHIDDEALQLTLKDNDATIQRLEANLDYAAKQLSRLQALTAQEIAARNALDQAESTKTMAEQDLVQARLAREQTLYRIERSRITAPFDGKVVERLAQPGGFVAPGGAIARFVDTRNTEVSARAPLSVAPFVRDGMKVTVKDALRSVESTVRSVIPVGDDRSRMFELRINLADAAWAIGSPVQVGLPSSAPQQVVAVPRDALILRSESIYVYKLTSDDTVERVAVETGIGNGPRIEVHGALSAGDRVVIRGGERLRPGQKVRILADG